MPTSRLLKFGFFLLYVGLGACAGPSVAAVRFVALGDAGEGNPAQFQNAAAIKNVCARKGCDFAVYLGDNFYNDGVSSLYDPQFQTKFEQPYAELNFPFYIALGNHDYGEKSVELWKPWYEVFYTFRSQKWRLPSHYYTFQAGNTAFYVLDSNAIMLGFSNVEQAEWLNAELSASTATWNIILTHHPYISNGKHGNAGNYEGCGRFCPESVSGRKIKDFVEKLICGRAQVYLSGHDHNMQWLASTCGTEFIVSGAGAKTTTFVNRDKNLSFWNNDTQVGFLWVEIQGNQFIGEFYDLNATLLFTRTLSR